ncbi:hypothetical protein SAMN05216371_8127 [Streptomyces sp. TLI_053]|nr:hypothetical protein SAMN05216371_8127 [Streptomyces sp. TLI_053]
MRRSFRFAGAAVLPVAAVLVTACTGDGVASPGADGSWALGGLAAVPAGQPLQATVDALPAEGSAKILGIAEVEGADVVLAIRNDICEVLFMAARSAGATPAVRSSFGAQRPSGSDRSDSHQGFPGDVLAGESTQATSQSPPLRFAALGCSERAMAVRIEGAGAAAESGGRAGDSLRAWRDGQDLVLTVGSPEAIHRPVPGPTS